MLARATITHPAPPSSSSHSWCSQNPWGVMSQQQCLSLENATKNQKMTGNSKTRALSG